MTMPAGKYYVGDLCYVLHDDWDEVCDIMFKNSSRMLEGEHTLEDGRRFAVHSTKWGDGCYRDQSGHQYGVDAGIIGCIRVEDIDVSLRESKSNFGGQIVEFKTSFSTSYNDGLIHIGHIEIDTDPKYEDADYEGDDDNALDEEF